MKDYTIYRIDLDTFVSFVYRYMGADNLYDIVKEQRKLSKWSRERGYESAWVYRESTSPFESKQTQELQPEL